MARRILTNQEKEILLNTARFKIETEWSIRNNAVYWKGQNGVNISTPEDAEKWFRYRGYGANILQNPSSIDPDINSLVVNRFLDYVKNYACVDDTLSVFDPDDTINYLLNDTSQNPAVNRFESMSEQWFADSTIFTIF